LFCVEGNDVILFDISGMRLGKTEIIPSLTPKTNRVDHAEKTSCQEE
jgi:hypothetical protein